MKTVTVMVSGHRCMVDTEVDKETLISVHDDVVRVDIVNIGEGTNGNYDPENPDDVNLLRFDVYVKNPYVEEGDEPWESVEDASYCTAVEADTDEDILYKIACRIFTDYRAQITSYDGYLNGPSVKKLGEFLSWINPTWVAA